MTNPDPPQLEVLMFVAGAGSAAKAQIAFISELLLGHDCLEDALQVIDLEQTPEAAIKYDILAIPTVLRVCPDPPARIIGELSDVDRIWTLLSK